MNSDVIDSRNISEFKTKTFTGYSKLKVKNELLNHLILQDIESSSFWCVELICSCQFQDIWDVIFLFANKHIHIANIEIPIYLNLRHKYFNSIFDKTQTLSMRNDKELRKLFSQIIVVCCSSNQAPAFEFIKVNKDFNLFKAPDQSFISYIYKNNDPIEFLLPFNELIYHLQNKNMKLACYWITWIIQNDSSIIVAANRNYCLIRPNDIIWIAWDIFYMWDIDKLKLKLINTLFDIFMIHYKHTSSKKNIYLFYYIIEILCQESVQVEYSIIKCKDKIQIVENSIDEFYLNIKNNEKKGEISYLFAGLL